MLYELFLTWLLSLCIMVLRLIDFASISGLLLFILFGLGLQVFSTFLKLFFRLVNYVW